MKSLQYIVITVFLVTTGFNCLTSKTRTYLKNHATGFLALPRTSSILISNILKLYIIKSEAFK